MLGDGVKADHLSYIGDADVGEGASFGCGSIVVNYDGNAKHRTRVGARAFIGCNANLIAPVEIERGRLRGGGLDHHEDVPAGALAVARAQQRNIEGWVERRRASARRSQAGQDQRSSLALAEGRAHVWNRRLRRSRATRAGRADRRAAPARVPRLRLGRRRDLRQGEIAIRRALGKLANLERRAARQAARRAHRRSATRAGPPTASPPSATRIRTEAGSRRGGAQRHHGELPRAARRARGGRPHDRLRHRHRADRAPDRRRARGGQGPGDARCARPARAWSAPTPSACARESDSGPHRRGQERRQPDRPRARREADASWPATSRPSCPTRARWCSSRTASSPCSRRTACRCSTSTAARSSASRAPIQWDPVSAEKGGYDRFMQKEIFEQPRAITDTIGTRVLESEADVDLDGIDLSRQRVSRDPPHDAWSPAAPPTTPAWSAST